VRRGGVARVIMQGACVNRVGQKHSALAYGLSHTHAHTRHNAEASTHVWNTKHKLAFLFFPRTRQKAEDNADGATLGGLRA
jgi:hypothetical protein